MDKLGCDICLASSITLYILLNDMESKKKSIGTWLLLSVHIRILVQICVQLFNYALQFTPSLRYLSLNTCKPLMIFLLQRLNFYFIGFPLSENNQKSNNQVSDEVRSSTESNNAMWNQMKNGTNAEMYIETQRDF